MKLAKLDAKYGGYGIWWEIRDKPGKLWFMKRSFAYDYETDPETVLKEWLNNIKCDNPYYIFIDFFGNGISFSIIEDVYGIMEEQL